VTRVSDVCERRGTYLAFLEKADGPFLSILSVCSGLRGVLSISEVSV
jgi:hypothetical protein